MIRETIPLKKTGYFSDLVIDYLEKPESLPEFYSYTPDIQGLKKSIRKRKDLNTADRDILHKVLKEQLRNCPAELKNDTLPQIDKLRNNNTFTVTTAHQPNIFTGYLYVIYKIISTINLADQLNLGSGDDQFVPLFWMGSEDHDIDEISRIKLFNKEITWENAGEGPSGRLSTGSMDEVMESVKAISGNGKYAGELKEIFEKAYQEHDNLANATQSLLYTLFAEKGLIVLNADDKRLKSLFLPEMRKELQEGVVYNTTQKVNVKLEERYRQQAHVREINLFYMKDHQRERIVKEGEHYEVLNSEIIFTETEILAELEQYPERFSPNVVLRPVYQEKILPNVSYTGGGSEVAYWLQLKPAFDHFKVPYPVVLLRNSFLFIDKRSHEKMKKMDLVVTDLFIDTDQLLKEYVEEHAKDPIELKEEKSKIPEIYQSVLKKALQIDKTLEKAVKAEQQKLVNSLENLENKLLKAEKRKFDGSLQQIRNLKERLFPENKLQERVDNFIPYYLKYGPEFFNQLAQQSDPLSGEFVVLMEN